MVAGASSPGPVKMVNPGEFVARGRSPPPGKASDAGSRFTGALGSRPIVPNVASRVNRGSAGLGERRTERGYGNAGCILGRGPGAEMGVWPGRL
jgi:hypothetical protein